MGDGAKTRKTLFTYLHNVVAFLLSVCGIGFLGVGIHMRIARTQADVDLQYVDNSFWSTAFTIANIVIALGVACTLVSVLATLAIQKTIGIERYVFKIIYVGTLVALIIWTSFVAFTGLSLVIGNMNALGLSSFVEASWKKTVAEKPTEACTVQENLKCKGFQDNSCSRCNLTKVATCSAEEKVVCPSCPADTSHTRGCYIGVLNIIVAWLRQAGFVAIALCAFLSTDLVIVSVLL